MTQAPPFDPYNGPTTGKPLFWDLGTHLMAIDQMIKADEIQIALQMCDQIPGWYRDNIPKEILALKSRIYQQTYDQIEYATDDEEAECTREFGEEQWHSSYCFPRAQILEDAVKALNDQGKVPWILDLGCSHGNLPLGLIKYGFKFTYCGKGMNYRIVKKLKGWIGNVWQGSPLSEDQPTILTCFETLEHAMNPHDLVHSAHKLGVHFDQIYLSTPMYCLGGGLPEWRERRIGHVRNWTPSEFADFARHGFPGYSWVLTPAYSMVLKGVR